MNFSKNDLVKNLKMLKWGIGLIVSISKDSLYIIFENVDGMKTFKIEKNPLQKFNHHGNLNNLREKLEKKFYGKLSIEQRISRDERNAKRAKELAKNAIKKSPFVSSDYQNYQAIMADPFHAMMEVETETKNENLKAKSRQLWYANEYSTGNLVFDSGNNALVVLSWTHPGVQLAMTGFLGESQEIRANGYTLTEVTPFSRAKFIRTLPRIYGLYEPGGRIGLEKKKEVTGKLKSVKLDMTREQVHAFISKMNGMMLVTGAPGSGKTTVGMQRIRFLYDQQELREDNINAVNFSPNLTKIFLANQNLIDYSRDILEKDLQIPSDVVELVDKFITSYLNNVWTFKHLAKPRRKKLFYYEERGRQAFFGLCSASQLKACWSSFESQIAGRMAQVSKANWLDLSSDPVVLEASKLLSKSLETYSKLPISNSPTLSRYQMDKVYSNVRKNYENLRELFRDTGSLGEFDSQFQKWLFWVYDPLDGIISYFSEYLYEGGIRIKNGIATKIPVAYILKKMREDWNKRSYGREEEPWLAFLLRFALPTENNPFERFREIPNPLSILGIENDRWTHVMIDEAQDLCVAEAALLSSFVHPEGAFTVAADFHQVVSPVWGMENPEAFTIGSSLRDKDTCQSFPFAKNMRQSKQISLFLQAFYRSIFREFAPFEYNDFVEGPSPLLILCNAGEFPRKIKQRLNVLKRNSSIKSIALIQINEDMNAMDQIRASLKNQGVELEPIWTSFSESGKLVTTSVERIKGLEYDACFVIGMDDVENSALKYSKNRAYVALSRPSIQLTILCEELPLSLQRIGNKIINVIR